MTLLADDPEIAGRSGTAVAPSISVTETGPEVVERDVAEAIALACDHLKARQEPDGWWKGELETNVTMDAEDILLRHFLGILDDKDADRRRRPHPLPATPGRALGNVPRRPGRAFGNR